MNNNNGDSGCFIGIIVAVLIFTTMAHGGHLIRVDEEINQLNNKIELMGSKNELS